MVNHKDIELQSLKKPAQLKRTENAKLVNPFTWINSLDLNSKKILSLMDFKLEPPFKLIQYYIPEKKTNLQQFQQLSILDPRNKIYYKKKKTYIINEVQCTHSTRIHHTYNYIGK